MITKTVALIGTFDTKGEEFSFLRERIESAGLRTLMIDVGVLGSPPFEADISQGEVAAAAKENLDALKTERDRGRSVTAMAVGAKAILGRLFEQGAIHGVASLGGSAGTAIATAAMRALPYGFPKLMVSTAGLRRYQALRGNQRHLHDAFGARHRGLESRLPPNHQQCGWGDLRHGYLGANRRSRREARDCGDHVWRHNTLRHGRSAHPRGERLRSSGLSRYGSWRTERWNS